MTAFAVLDALATTRFLALEVDLEPLGGPTIQPTTFANTGTSFYVAPDGHLAAIVDSVASMANQLELTIWNEAEERPAEAVAALPWVRAVDGQGRYYTSSRRAAHRLNAHAIMNGRWGNRPFKDDLTERLHDPPAPVIRRLAEVVYELDPLAIVQGCWFPGVWDGRARITRALSARIDAFGVESQGVQVGGQKTSDHLDEVRVKHTPGSEEKTVEGERPVYMAEVSARRIVASILVDLGLLRSYRLSGTRERALSATAVLMIGELIAAWPRRRSRCALSPVGVRVREPEGWEMPPLEELREACRVLCEAATGETATEPVEVVYMSTKAKGS